MRQIYQILVIAISSIIKAIGIVATAAETEAESAFPEAAKRLNDELTKASKAKKLP